MADMMRELTILHHNQTAMALTLGLVASMVSASMFASGAYVISSRVTDKNPNDGPTRIFSAYQILQVNKATSGLGFFNSGNTNTGLYNSGIGNWGIENSGNNNIGFFHRNPLVNSRSGNILKYRGGHKGQIAVKSV